MSKTQGKSLPELRREQNKLTAMIAAEEADQLKQKKAREEKIEKEDGKVLVPQSPSKSPRKTKSLVNWTNPTRPLPESKDKKTRYNGASGRFNASSDITPKPLNPTHVIPAPPRPSSFLSSVSNAASSSSSDQRPQIQRSSTFAAPAAAPPPPLRRKGKEREQHKEPVDAEWEEKGALGTHGGGKREEDGTIAEKLEMGPKEFGMGPGGDSEWKTVEPNSGIRLSKRVLSHQTLQDHLSDRFHVPPSLLYSIVRLSRDGTFYDIPLLGDWITIAVVAEKNGGVKFTKGGPAIGDEASDEEDEAGAAPVKRGPDGKKPAKKDKAKNKGQMSKKFVTFKLVSLPTKSSGKAATGGDASLTMLLFEADSFTTGGSRNGGKKVYKGGSGGAFEKYWNLQVGTVVAILNPRVLRPMKNGISPHPLTNALAINPESAESITEIGMSKDMGTCTAIKLSGDRCENWVDKRTTEVCDFHLTAALKKSRSGRAEFSSSTSAFAIGSRSLKSTTSSSSRPSPKTSFAFNPATKTGLLPRNTPGLSTSTSSNATFIVGGHVVRPDRPHSMFGAPEYTSEKIGRNKDALVKRKREDAEAEEQFLRLLGRAAGKTQGGKNLVEAMKREEEERVKNGGQPLPVKKAKKGEGDEDGEGERGEEGDGKRKRRNKGFSAEAIKRIGFDPTMPIGVVRRDERDEKKRVDALALLFDHPSTSKRSSRPPLLGPVPGPKHRSSVTAPPSSSSQREVNLDSDSDDDLEVGRPPPGAAGGSGSSAAISVARMRPTNEEVRKARRGDVSDDEDNDL